MDVIKELPKYVSVKARLSFLESEAGLQLIGQGSSRNVYDLGDGRVLKVALGYKGFSQNVFEAQFYEKTKHKDLFAKIIYSISKNRDTDIPF